MKVSWFLVNLCILVNPCATQISDCTTTCDTIFQYAFTHFVLDKMNRSACYIKFYEKIWIIPILPCSFSPNTVWWNDMSRKCELHISNFFHSSMNLRIYCKFDLNHPVAYFPFRNLYTFCMHRLTRKQPIKRLVLGDVISRSFLPERYLIFCYISHDWKDDKFLYTMIYRLTIIYFDYLGYSGIYDKMHWLTKEVDIWWQCNPFHILSHLIEHSFRRF